jgi:hypothetical protein
MFKSKHQKETETESNLTDGIYYPEEIRKYILNFINDNHSERFIFHAAKKDYELLKNGFEDFKKYLESSLEKEEQRQRVLRLEAIIKAPIEYNSNSIKGYLVDWLKGTEEKAKIEGAYKARSSK